MAVLTEGRKLSLSSVTDQNDVSVLYVKLTDSSLRAIEEFCRGRENKQSASICFNGNQGVMKIPNKDVESVKSFQFSVASMPNNDGSFECIQHDAKRGKDRLEALGAVIQKLTIQANDDVYQNTIEKSRIAEEANKKVCTKEIKPGGPKNGQRVKKVIKKTVRNVLSQEIIHNNNLLTSNSPKQMIVRSVKPNRQQQQTLPKIKPQDRTAATASPTGGRISPYPNGNHPKNGPNESQSVVTFSMNFAIRERIIHLLALKSYKKPELLLKLQMDGLCEKDRDLIGSIVEKVAQVSARDGSFSLQRQFYASDVKRDWPLYSDEDRLLLNRKLNSMAINSPAISPCPNNESQGSPSTLQKASSTAAAAAAAAAADGGPAAKKRKSENKKKSPVAVMSTSPARNIVASKARSLPFSSFPSAATPAATADSSCLPNGDSGDNNLTNDEDFSIEYPAITSYEHRCRYKEDFNNKLVEYKRIHEKVLARLEIIEFLNQSLRREPEGSDKHDVYKEKLCAEFVLLKNDSTYTDDRKRHDYLHKKMEFIKRLVNMFDETHPTSTKSK